MPEFSTRVDPQTGEPEIMGADSLQQVADEVRGCTLCKLSRGRRNAVPGEGNPVTKIMFIGEAPGRSEDEKGRPFVGSAGKILDIALEKAGISRSDVFITNVVKCRPPENREPEQDELSSCRQYLERQISIIDPVVICILGKTALNSLLGPEMVKAKRGTLIEKNGRRYFISLHPAATIYNRGLSAVFQEDMKTLAREFSKISGGANFRMEDFT